MKSDDPNFPQDIPSIPEPQDYNNGALSRQGTPEDWDDTVGAEGPEQGAASVDSPPPPKPAKPPVRQSGAIDGSQREAEKPVAASNPLDDWGQAEVPYQPKELGIIDQLMLLLADGAAGWRKVLRWVRSQLPARWQRRLSDELMTAIALGGLVLLLVLWHPLGGGQPTGPAAKNPLPGVEAPETAPQPARADGEPGLTATSAESPEQSLIAGIQAKVSDISRAYAAGLIQSVEVNLPETRLIVNLGESWYGLRATQQNQVSQNIYEQVQQLDFQILQLRDPNGVVVARNPVVGNTMVILHRSRAADADLFMS